MKTRARGNYNQALLRETLVKIGERAQRFRLAANLTLSEVAMRAGIPTNRLREIERGRINLRTTTLRRVAHALCIEPVDLVNIGNDRRAAVIDLTRNMSEEELVQLHNYILSCLGARELESPAETGLTTPRSRPRLPTRPCAKLPQYAKTRPKTFRRP